MSCTPCKPPQKTADTLSLPSCLLRWSTSSIATSVKLVFSVVTLPSSLLPDWSSMSSLLHRHFYQTGFQRRHFSIVTSARLVFNIVTSPSSLLSIWCSTSSLLSNWSSTSPYWSLLSSLLQLRHLTGILQTAYSL